MKIIDLSQPLFSGMNVYPGDPKVSITRFHTYEQEGWKLTKICMGSHTGTHVDAFSHMHRDGESLDSISLEHFFGKARLVSSTDPFPSAGGLIFSDTIDLPVTDKILRVKPPFVGGEMSEDAERLLLKNRIITYTGLINLDRLPVGKDFMFYGFPLNIEGGDGSPVRAVAIIEGDF